MTLFGFVFVPIELESASLLFWAIFFGTEWKNL